MSFLRADNVVCGTTTTSTGTLTLAACPAPPGGTDFYAAFSGMGLGTSQSIPASYTIIEYTDTNFTTAKQMEKGVGALTIGANVGATTLARTTRQATATGMNTSTPTYSDHAPAAINIGTAANTLVFIGASALDVPACSPYYETGIGDNLGAYPPTINIASSGAVSLTNDRDVYTLFDWRVPMLVKRCSTRVQVAYTGGTSDLVARLYEIGSNGRPGKLLYDFGKFATAGSGLSATGNISSGAGGSGFMLPPGEYFLNHLAEFSGGSGSPSLVSWAATISVASFHSGRLTGTTFIPYFGTHASSGSMTAPDPANVTSYAGDAANTVGPVFSLNSA